MTRKRTEHQQRISERHLDVTLHRKLINFEIMFNLVKQKILKANVQENPFPFLFIRLI